MSHAALTAKYRPQSFAELAGQEMLSSILSRASAESRIAPAYLFSGTRGVGKTTVARIFAKALNCETAPTPEPCNQCEQCRKITQGLAVDVMEIDGASNRGIDDIRKLKESVGYAPMEGRYKVFIIDEAHMLSREAFNALLKTLEEPPARVTFILATTEPHKFPATILSRCQHYVFKRLPGKALEAHLESILRREGVKFEAGAVRLVAERGAGSVRDSMSLLGQALALGDAELSEVGVRSVLGLAGQEIFFKLLEAIEAEDCPAIVEIISGLLDQGLDLGFFLRELGNIWRNLFILRQSGQAGLRVLGLSEEEGKTWLALAGRFAPAHIHAAWQMILDGQRRVLNSLEPALALEHLLLNLALLARLLPLERHDTHGTHDQHGPTTPQQVQNNQVGPVADEKKNFSLRADLPETPKKSLIDNTATPAQFVASAPPQSESQPKSKPEPNLSLAQTPLENKATKALISDPEVASSIPEDPLPNEELRAMWGQEMETEKPNNFPVLPRNLEDLSHSGSLDWDSFLRYSLEQPNLPQSFMPCLRSCSGEWREGTDGPELVIHSDSLFNYERLCGADFKNIILELVQGVAGISASYQLEITESARLSPAQIRQLFDEHSGVRALVKDFDARMVNWGTVKTRR